MAKTPCVVCHRHDKTKGKTKCIECWLRSQPVDARVARAQQRATMLPAQFHAPRIPADHWPPGRRWCAGCQSFVLLKDCGSGSARCKTCASVASHGTRLKATYLTRDTDGTVRPFTAEDFAAMHRAQGGLCFICGRPSKTKRLAVDHDHATGLVRHLLCPGDWGCNRSLIGIIESHPDPLRTARRILAYLEESRS